MSWQPRKDIDWEDVKWRNWVAFREVTDSLNELAIRVDQFAEAFRESEIRELEASWNADHAG